MMSLIDKTAIFALTAAFYLSHDNPGYKIAFLLAAIILSAGISYLERERLTLAVFAAYVLLSLWVPDLVYFLPLLCYDAAGLRRKWAWLFAALPLLTPSYETFFLSSGLIAVMILLAVLLKRRTTTLQHLERDYYRLRDNAQEIAMRLETQNRELVDKQDHEVTLATLTERNRIARDIHDNVGHLLSRSILQVGALLAVNKDEATRMSLGLVQDTLSEAMDSIRASVHNLHEESVDLQAEIRRLIDSFAFCPVTFDYEVASGLDKTMKYGFIAVTKEALSNIIKHSNATAATVRVREHPAFYQLIIWDNGAGGGSGGNPDGGDGIGLRNIADRVAALGGRVHISTDKGFRIFLSVPKPQAS